VERNATNSSPAYPVAITDMETDRVREIFEVNLFAPMRMVKEFAHLLIAAGDARIVHIGSISGIMPVPFGAAYNTSKAALHSFCNTARVELAPFKYTPFLSL
jgi:1-acylglycerone phosphate reductase